MQNELVLGLLVGVPCVGAFALPLASRVSERTRNLASLLFLLVSLAATVRLMPVVLSGATVTVPFGGVDLLYADRLAVFMAFVSSLVGAIIILYSFGYISHYEHRDEYYFMVVLFLGSMMGLIFARNLIALYLFWEITAIACWRLIGYFREKNHVLKADKAFLVTVFGALLMLVGFIIIYDQTGSFDLGKIKTALSGTTASNLAVVLILCGILSKSATVPLHTWLPDAGVAPSPVTALLHAAVLVKIGVYVYARLFLVTIPVAAVWHTIVPAMAGASALVAGGAALVETDLKRIIAYSTVSQIGFIFLGLSIGNTIGVAGGLVFILMHGIAKAGLFLCAGIVEQNAGTKDIRKLGGLISGMPVTAVAFILCAFSVMGVPPLGGFFSKYMVISGAIQSGQAAIAVIFLAGAVLTIVYLFRLFSMIFLGEPSASLAPNIREGSRVMVVSVGILAALSI
ncbi:MAG TPA: NADH-quinone oxidoreductase subunit L, partial [Candidatus Bathyarchaeia archaeon]|nr:NADH-quinone oxidoreductase subunit L [Candidatus Bathyarchaeia archaeon]